MPSKNFSSVLGRYYESDAEKAKVKADNDNKAQKRRFWKKKWNIEVTHAEYDEFNKYSKEISKVQKFLKFFQTFNKNQIESEEQLFMYGKFARNIEFVYKNPDAVKYIMTLEKINNDELKEVSISDEEFYKTDSSEDNCIILDSE
tara:strand:+ start:211 stop:645 length:435 start_codon:yes stop_codon:yes gene_type:complete